MNDVHRRLFARYSATAIVATEPIAADGSQRRMVRLRGAGGITAIAVTGTDPEEDRAFLSYSKAFRSIGLPVPLVYAVDEDTGIYLLEDLGDVTLFLALTQARAAEGGDFPASMLPVYRRVLEELPRFQVEGGRVVDYAFAYPRAAFDRPSMRWDLDYFKYHFVKLAKVPFNENRLERDAERLVDFLLEADTSHFLYRDFQSRNVMLREGAPWFIDYQGGRRGALQYDVASLLYDAKAAIPEPVREALLEHYLDALATHLPVDRERFRAHYRGYVLIRILQAMGAYGYRGFYERKAHFLKSVPHAVGNLERLLATGFVSVDLPELRTILERICATPAFRSIAPPPPVTGLTVRVGSFSYRLGLPDDPSGHGGGFVFDCRAIENPAKHPEFADRTGLDPDVVKFLEADSAAAGFFDGVLVLVERQVAVYEGRGFTSVDVQFGCTGGQHRSVYFAERLARAIMAKFPSVRVALEHRERGRWPILTTRAFPGNPAPSPARP